MKMQKKKNRKGRREKKEEMTEEEIKARENRKCVAERRKEPRLGALTWGHKHPEPSPQQPGSRRSSVLTCQA